MSLTLAEAVSCIQRVETLYKTRISAAQEHLKFIDGWLQAGMIVDDELNRLLVNPLIPGVRLHVVLGKAKSSPELKRV